MSHAVHVDSTPLDPAQIRALLVASARELSWGLRKVARELRRWRALAEQIPDVEIRNDALYALERRRTNTDGAALFSTLLDQRDFDLLRLLAVYQAIWDFLDSLGERHPTELNGRELHLALVDALDHDRPLADYYRYHPWRNDGGYLIALVEFCRARCQSLPSYERVRALVVAEAQRAQVQALNHLPDRARRDAALQRWAAQEFPRQRHLRWFELTAAASASLVIHPLLALGAKAGVTDKEIEATRSNYWPLVSLVTTMLDNHSDQQEDREEGNHNYFTHYRDSEVGIALLCGYIRTLTRGVRALPEGERHAVVVSSMIAMYLSKDGDGTPEMERARRELACAGGSLVRLLVPILRAWRVMYSQRSA